MTVKGIVTLGLCALVVVGSTGCPNNPEPIPPPIPAPTWIGSNLEPMVVDWQPEQRGDLEVAMKQGVAVVQYDAKGFRLLRDCHVDGKYGFMGTTRREKVVHLDTADDIRANLPLGGFGLAAKIGGELEHGASIDIAMVMIGQVRTTWQVVSRKDLLGPCEGASHFVRGATLGAFAMDKGQKTQARVAAEIFKLGVGGGHSSASQFRNVDGQFDDCSTAKPEGASPPSQCGALVRLELAEIAAGEATAAPVEKPSIAVDPCPKPLVFADGKCTQASSVAAKPECTYGDGTACLNACKAGTATSCAKLGLMLVRGDNVPKDQTSGAKLLIAACEADLADACMVVGDIVAEGIPGVTKNPTDALKLYAKACDMGSADACQRFGARVLTGMGVTKNPQLAAQAMERGCNGGSKDACSDLGLLFLGGSPPFKEDLPRAAGLFKLACDGMSGVGCGNLGYMLEFGQGVTRNINVSLAAYLKGCKVDNQQCLWLGAMFFTGKGVKKDDKQAVDLWKAACTSGSVPACAILRGYVDPNVKLDMEIAQAYVNLWQGTCGNNLARDCSGLGVLLVGAGHAPEGEKILAKGCSLGDDWGCMMAKLKHN